MVRRFTVFNRVNCSFLWNINSEEMNLIQYIEIVKFINEIGVYIREQKIAFAEFEDVLTNEKYTITEINQILYN